MPFVDTHCHLDFASYQPDLVEVIERAVDQGVNRIIVPGINLASSQRAVLLSEEFPVVYAAVGVHPGELETFTSDQIPEFKQLLSRPKVIGVGEIGLDMYHRQDNLTLQKEVLQVFLQLASDYQKPVILHSRNCLEELQAEVFNFTGRQPGRNIRGVFHAFKGDYHQAEILLQRGFLIGIGGPITYKNNTLKHELLSKIDLSQVILETDGPFLPPEGYRGKRNESAFIPIIARKIAELKQCDIQEVADLTTHNAYQLFILD